MDSFLSDAQTQQQQISKKLKTFKEPPMDVVGSSDRETDLAATKLQKVYKSFRTRRQIADCAILVDQRWWMLLDFAELKRSSVSFFDLENKHESAISRWSRARTRAAKLGKGLSKTDKAQKLAHQHWLEAIDPRHRYGHNLHFYYIKWLYSQTQQPFFYWLDVGEGKEVNLVDKCPRTKLQQQCVKYLGPLERKPYEVIIVGGKFLYKQTQELLHTTEAAKWIFVLSTSKTLYVGKKKKGRFQHSSFLAGGATIAAGEIVTENGILKAVWPHSGHYRTTEENFKEFVSFLAENNVDLSDVKMTHVDEEGSSSEGHTRRKHLRRNSFEADLTDQTLNCLETEDMYANGSPSEEEDTIEHESISAVKRSASMKYLSFRRKPAHLEVPKHWNWELYHGSSIVLSRRHSLPTSFTQEMTSQNSPKGLTCRDVSLLEPTPLPLIY